MNRRRRMVGLLIFEFDLEGHGQAVMSSGRSGLLAGPPSGVSTGFSGCIPYGLSSIPINRNRMSDRSDASLCHRWAIVQL